MTRRSFVQIPALAAAQAQVPAAPVRPLPLSRQPPHILFIKFHRIRLNRDSAGSGDRIVPSAVEPGYYPSAKFDDKFSSEWKLDREAGLGTLAKPTDRLKNFKVKLQPMLGCVAVAPPMNQSYRAEWLGSWGGNMDYNDTRWKATASSTETRWRHPWTSSSQWK